MERRKVHAASDPTVGATLPHDPRNTSERR